MGRGRGGCWRKEERGGGPGEAPGSGKGWRGGGGVGAKEEARGRGGKWRPGEGEGVQPERAEQRGASEGRRQPPGRGCGSLVNSRPGSGAFLTLEIFRGFGLWFGQGGGGFDLDGKDIITIFVQQS